METEIKKRKHRKGGTDYAKEKLAKAEAKIKELEHKCIEADNKYITECKHHDNTKVELHNAKADLIKSDKKIKELEETIRQQGTTISTLTAEKANLEGDVRYYRTEADKYLHRMGWLRRWLYELKNKTK